MKKLVELLLVDPKNTILVETTDWNKIKNDVIQTAKKAGITDKGFIKTVLGLERGVLTCKNNLYSGRMSWNTMTNSTAYHRAYDEMEKLYNHGFSDRAIYQDMWIKYCKFHPEGITPDGDLGDWLA